MSTDKVAGGHEQAKRDVVNGDDNGLDSALDVSSSMTTGREGEEGEEAGALGLGTGMEIGMGAPLGGEDWGQFINDILWE